MLNSADKFDILSNIIRSRRAIFPAQFDERTITDEVLQKVIETANWAPTHKRTEPWRFHIIRDQGLSRLAEYLGERYRESPKGGIFSEVKYKKTKQRVLRSSAVIAIVMARDESESVPEWEEIAATAMAVQNIWLSCEAQGIGTYWSSPGLFTENNTFLNLKYNEKSLGLMYMGYYEPESKAAGERKPMADKITWVRK